jgi:hypothetical protein
MVVGDYRSLPLMQLLISLADSIPDRSPHGRAIRSSLPNFGAAIQHNSGLHPNAEARPHFERPRVSISSFIYAI